MPLLFKKLKIRLKRWRQARSRGEWRLPDRSPALGKPGGDGVRRRDSQTDRRLRRKRQIEAGVKFGLRVAALLVLILVGYVAVESVRGLQGSQPSSVPPWHRQPAP